MQWELGLRPNRACVTCYTYTGNTDPESLPFYNRDVTTLPVNTSDKSICVIFQPYGCHVWMDNKRQCTNGTHDGVAQLCNALYITVD